ncbi:hypothetical protein CN217_24215 [Sinorhizobium meliloti]|nr:hypothetical protein CN217_24215 [Sinorhizobium meliloti]
MTRSHSPRQDLFLPPGRLCNRRLQHRQEDIRPRTPPSFLAQIPCFPQQF